MRKRKKSNIRGRTTEPRCRKQQTECKLHNGAKYKDKPYSSQFGNASKAMSCYAIHPISVK